MQYLQSMAVLIKDNPYLQKVSNLHRVIAANVRDSFAFEGIRIEAPRNQARPRVIVPAKKSAKG
jgi:hypothetical protein